MRTRLLLGLQLHWGRSIIGNNRRGLGLLLVHVGRTVQVNIEIPTVLLACSLHGGANVGISNGLEVRDDVILSAHTVVTVEQG